ncbi:MULTISPECIES: hypothetical protein [unclassified Bartonella]|uniref:hypothetical protein n=1 Tax=unclassified Bartonella TaxID=2645622 RepID=UPI0035D02422
MAGEVVKACLDVLEQGGASGSFCGECWGSTMTGKCFFIAETMVRVMLSFLRGSLGAPLGEKSFAGIFLADMGKDVRGMRKSLCGIKRACWGKGWGAGCGRK